MRSQLKVEPRTKTLRVLLIAEAANPEWTSVPLVGWSLATALRQRDDIDGHLVTHARNRAAIERAGLVEGRDFTAIDSDRLTRPAYKLASFLRGGKNKGWTLVTAIASLVHPYFEHLVWKQFGERIRNHEFDVVHRVTPLTPTSPSLLARRCAKVGVPFLLGPLNGGVPWPREFTAARRKEREWLSYVRNAYKLIPGYRGTRKYAAAIIVGSSATRDQVPTRYHHKCVYIPENAIDPQRFPTPPSRPDPTLPLRACFVGRLVPYKGADMLIEAAAPLARDGRLIVDIYGGGPEMSGLKQQIESAGLTDRIRLHGRVPHQQLHERLTSADIFAFPSIREFGGGVVLEAMALGVVPLVVDYGGPGELVTPDTGFLIPIGNRTSIVNALRDLLTHLCENPLALKPLARNGQRRVAEEFTWQAKAARVRDVYRHVLTNGRSV